MGCEAGVGLCGFSLTDPMSGSPGFPAPCSRDGRVSRVRPLPYRNETLREPDERLISLFYDAAALVPLIMNLLM